MSQIAQNKTAFTIGCCSDGGSFYLDSGRSQWCNVELVAIGNGTASRETERFFLGRKRQNVQRTGI